MHKNIIIIGSGLSGTTLANLLKDNFSVTVLEKGGENISIPSKKYINRKFGDSVTYCNGIGGTTNLWHNGLIKMPLIKENNIFSNVLDDSLSEIDYAAKLLKFPNSFVTERKARLNEYKYILKDILPDTEIDTILIPNCNVKAVIKEGINVIYNVSNIEYNYVTNSIKSIICTIENGEQIKIDCDYIIVASGGISTPTVISEILAPFDVKNNYTNQLIDHPMGFVGKIKVKKKYRHIFKQLVNKNNGDYTSRCGIVIKDEDYAHICYFRPAFTLNNKLDLYKFKSFLGTATLKEKIKCIFDKKFYHPDILLEVLMYFTSIQIDNGVYCLWFVFEQKKDLSSNKVIPDSNIDTIDWSINDIEKNSYYKAINKIKEKLGNIVDDINVIDSNIEDYLWSAAHHSGTVTYGDNKYNLDINLKLNALDNVYVCDASVINEHSYANTGLTIAQLCCRLSKHLLTKESV